MRVQEPEALANELVGMYRKKPLHGLHPFSVSPSHSKATMEKVKVMVCPDDGSLGQNNHCWKQCQASDQPFSTTACNIMAASATASWCWRSLVQFGRTSEILRWNLYNCHSCLVRRDIVHLFVCVPPLDGTGPIFGNSQPLHMHMRQPLDTV